MELLVRRLERSTNGEATIGELYIDGQLHSFTLEDRVREVPGQPVEQWKVKGQTAIPQGRYKLSLVNSPHFKCIVPLLHDVPGFSAVEIHTGNRDEDTEGCLLVAYNHTAGQDFIANSTEAFNALMDKLAPAFGVEWTQKDARGRPTQSRQVSPAQEVWITYQTDFTT